MRLFGKEGTLEGCEVKGIQGGVSTEEGTFTIKSGKYYTYNTEGNQDAFYPVYATNGTTIIVDGGDFYGPNNRSNLANGTSCLVSGDNDTGRPVGTFVINGGRFSGKAYNHVTNSIYAEDSWVETTDAENPLIKWTVK